MKKNALTTIILLTALSTSSLVIGQSSNVWKKYRHDFTVGYGYNTLLATVGEKDNIGLNYMLQRSSFNLSYRYFIFNHFAVRGEFSQLYARKNDKDLNREDRDNLRIDYETSMSEFGAMAEFHFFDETGKSRTGSTSRARGGISRLANIGLSIYAGIAGTYFRPVGEFVGQKVYLKPLNANPGFDLNVDSYPKWNLHFPVGANIRLVLTENWRVGIDAGYRFGIRPYIDNISGVYYDSDIAPEGLPINSWPDYTYAGYVHFDDEQKSIADLKLQSGRMGYFVGMFTVSYRLKTR